MAAILDRHEPPETAATRVVESQSGSDAQRGSRGCSRLRAGRQPTALAHAVPPPRAGGFEQWIVGHKIPVGDAMAVAIDYIKAHGTFLFDGISIVIRGMVDGVTALLRALPAPGADRRGRSARVAAAAFSGPCRFRRACAAVHSQPGLLAGDARDAVARHGGDLGVDSHRRAARASRRRTGRACSRPCGRCSI